MTVDRFQLSDANGQTHDYDHAFIPAREGDKLRRRMVAILGETGVHAVQVATEAVARAGAADLAVALANPVPEGDEVRAAEVETMRAKARLGAMLLVDTKVLDDADRLAGAILRAFSNDDAASWTRDMLRHVTRDGTQRLGDDVVYDMVYAGNLDEADEAAIEVARQNGFFARLGTLLGSVRKAVGAG